MHIQQETSPIVPRGDIKGACGGFVGLMSTVFQTPIFLPGGLLVAKPGAGPSSFSGTDAKAAKPSPFVAECGVLSSSGRHGRTKSSSGDKSTVKPPHIGGKATTLLSAAKVPADASLRVNLASKELLDGDVIGSTKALLSVGSNGVSTNSRWAKTASKKAALLPGLNKQPLYEVSLDVQSGVDTSGGVSVKTGPLVYAPKLWGKREKIMSLASLFSLSSSSSLPLPLLQPRVPIERTHTHSIHAYAWPHWCSAACVCVTAGFLPTLARVLRVPNEKPYPTLLESDVSVSHNTASVNSTVKGFGGHGLHWAVSGGLKAGTGGKPASESNAADGRTPHVSVVVQRQVYVLP